MPTPANYQRHAHIFASHFGPDGTPAVAVISGSSTGVSKGLVQMIPLAADGTLGVKDPLKMYTVSTYSDVANLQARGKRNPNNQAKGFINGLGDMPNPGFDKVGGFYPEAKTFSLSTVTGYSSATAKDVGKRESIYISLIPSTWKAGLQTTPGVPNENAGNGPAPRVAAPATDPGATAGGSSDNNVLDGTQATHPDEGNTPSRGAQFGGQDDSGCNVSHSSSNGGTGAALALAFAGVLALARRNRKSEES
jgi:MYXO-CTERM domain-containing protein